MPTRQAALTVGRCQSVSLNDQVAPTSGSDQARNISEVHPLFRPRHGRYHSQGARHADWQRSCKGRCQRYLQVKVPSMGSSSADVNGTESTTPSRIPASLGQPQARSSQRRQHLRHRSHSRPGARAGDGQDAARPGRRATTYLGRPAGSETSMLPIASCKQVAKQRSRAKETARARTCSAGIMGPDTAACRTRNRTIAMVALRARLLWVSLGSSGNMKAHGRRSACLQRAAYDAQRHLHAERDALRCATLDGGPRSGSRFGRHRRVTPPSIPASRDAARTAGASQVTAAFRRGWRAQRVCLRERLAPWGSAQDKRSEPRARSGGSETGASRQTRGDHPDQHFAMRTGGRVERQRACKGARLAIDAAHVESSIESTDTGGLQETMEGAARRRSCIGHGACDGERARCRGRGVWCQQQAAFEKKGLPIAHDPRLEGVAADDCHDQRATPEPACIRNEVDGPTDVRYSTALEDSRWSAEVGQCARGRKTRRWMCEAVGCGRA